MGGSRSVLLIVDVTRLTNNAHMQEFIVTLGSSTELTAGVGQAEAEQFAVEVPPVTITDSDRANGAKNVHCRPNQTGGSATDEAGCTNENIAAT